jgi:peptidoglycan/LPS O-acetylase OafA/YrhL
MYLLHVPALYLVFMVLSIKNLFFGPLLFLVLTMVASFITYHIIESPFIDIGRRLSSSPAPTPVPLAAQNTQEGS